ncbi:MAG: L,D-transpeptidase family protein [Bacillota bacterium]
MLVLVLVGIVVGTVHGAGVGQKQIDPAALRAVRWQLALEREGFSPGLIDGCLAGKTTLAIKEFQRARGLAITGKLDEATGSALRINEVEPLTNYTVRPEDLKQVTGSPGTWVEKSKKRYLGYRSLTDALAEKHHCTQGLLMRLNRGKNLARLRAGDTIRVPRTLPPRWSRAKQLEVNLGQRVIRAFDEQKHLVGMFHCSIAAQVSKRPGGQTRIVVVAENPSYTFDPRKWPEVKGVEKKLLIPPGPRNPVGLCWIGLGLPGYGIHGTPNPELIGKTGSHGCLRLSNWDAKRLGRMVRVGTPVKFVG